MFMTSHNNERAPAAQSPRAAESSAGRGGPRHRVPFQAVRWSVLVPLKSLPDAKSRLRDGAGEQHGALVAAMREDTLAAACAASAPARVIIVADRPTDARPEDAQTTAALVFVQRAAGLNAGLAEAAEFAATRWPADGIAVLVGDLPALTAAELDAALRAASGAPRGFARDTGGTGTTLLAAVPGTALAPAFGPGSAARHQAGAIELPAGPGLRHDVDTLGDLRAALALRLGPRTHAIADRLFG